MVCSIGHSSQASLHRHRGWSMRIVITAALLVCAAFAAPEEPNEQASICLRHHSPAACRVW
ncbi:hypothetical protein [Synechococcus sp. MIT S1220]|uniref:hypothetical protein n=1 Tax=Synechococcus sp. MIT S1220 TaxID=3082549 RepID=UPI0039AFCE28